MSTHKVFLFFFNGNWRKLSEKNQCTGQFASQISKKNPLHLVSHRLFLDKVFVCCLFFSIKRY